MTSRTRVALLAAGVAAMAAFWLSALICPGAFDYAEGDTATWIWLVRHGRDLYAPLGGLPLLSTNYPPLQLRLVAWLAPSDASILVTGRLVALVGFGLALVAVGASVKRASGSRKWGLFAAALLTATVQPGYHAVTARADTLALGLGCLAVAQVALRVRGWPLASAVLFTLSLLCKHNLIVLPGGTILWALARDRRRGVALALSTAALLGGAIFALGLWTPLVAWSIAGWKARTFLRYFSQAVLPSTFGLILVGWLWQQRAALDERARQVTEPWAAVLAVGVVWWLALGRTGSSANYLLEFFCALAVLVSVAIARGAPSRIAHAHLACVALETLGWVIVHLAVVLPQARKEAVAARQALAGVDGAVLAEQTWHASIAGGKAPIVIPFLATQLGYAGLWDPRPLVGALARGEVARLLVGFPLEDPSADDYLHDDRFAPEVLAEMRARYRRVSAQSGLYVYAPKDPAEAGSSSAR